ncbi:SDNA polymerase theta short isoform [Tieghemostelium lacteum]|uniref:DNA-directed DNA polymerase n=1 Tax=Tieghemostelium lacteum TaxID=361077 RepID=A0A152A7U7_TIELA|nr:SDNA polymerase theta short isoform [Tieghemostelium lacteum]|eukprot:KYR02201.1 SDNA polymerase theta short isoform [Tieghemostelium lacteum]
MESSNINNESYDFPSFSFDSVEIHSIQKENKQQQSNNRVDTLLNNNIFSNLLKFKGIISGTTDDYNQVPNTDSLSTFTILRDRLFKLKENVDILEQRHLILQKKQQQEEEQQIVNSKKRKQMDENNDINCNIVNKNIKLDNNSNLIDSPVGLIKSASIIEDKKSPPQEPYKSIKKLTLSSPKTPLSINNNLNNISNNTNIVNNNQKLSLKLSISKPTTLNSKLIIPETTKVDVLTTMELSPIEYNDSDNEIIFLNYQLTIDQLMDRLGKCVNIKSHENNKSWTDDKASFSDTILPFKVHKVSQNCYKWFQASWAAQIEFSFTLCFESLVLQLEKDVGLNNAIEEMLAEESVFLPELFEIKGLVVTWGHATTVYFLPLTESEDSTLTKEMINSRWSFIRLVLENQYSYKYLYNMKPQLKLFLYKGIKVKHNLMDPKIAAWLLESDKNKDRTLSQLYLEYTDTISRNVTVGKNLFDRSFLCCQRTINTMQSLLKRLHYQKDLLKIFLDIEMKILPIFSQMEYDGIGFSDQQFDYSKSLIESKIKYLTYKSRILLPWKSHEKIDLGSLDEMSDVLYTDLKLPKPDNIPKDTVEKGKKSFWSTNAAHMDSISHYHPMPAIITEYRRLTHHVTHYIEILGKYQFSNKRFNSMRRIYSTILQTIVPTGRITMVYPNLQNIPHPIEFLQCPGGIDFSQESIPSPDDDISKDTFDYSTDPNYINLLKLEKKCEKVTLTIRDSFIPKKGCIFLSVDYSQIELRILTHFSRDEKLMDLFNEKKHLDVFKVMSHQITGVPLELITTDSRNFAKHLCYGILYGMGAKSLAKKLFISVDKAKGALSSINTTYHQLSKYLKSVDDSCVRDGFVSTLYGRKRFFPEVTATTDFAILGKNKRAARNTIPQGTAADIIKLAMVRIQEQFEQLHLKSIFVLQLHDELLFEVPEEELDQLAPIVKNIMENIVELAVPLPIRMATGYSWGSLKPYVCK